MFSGRLTDNTVLIMHLLYYNTLHIKESQRIVKGWLRLSEGKKMYAAA
jgi:hypothetical protein